MQRILFVQYRELISEALIAMILTGSITLLLIPMLIEVSGFFQLILFLTVGIGVILFIVNLAKYLSLKRAINKIQ